MILQRLNRSWIPSFALLATFEAHGRSGKVKLPNSKPIFVISKNPACSLRSRPLITTGILFTNTCQDMRNGVRVLLFNESNLPEITWGITLILLHFTSIGDLRCLWKRLLLLSLRSMTSGINMNSKLVDQLITTGFYSLS